MVCTAQSARHQISTLGLDGILYLVGVRDRDLLHEDADEKK